MRAIGADVAAAALRRVERRERKRARKARKRKLVRRRYLTTIIAAWLITVPCAAALSALLYLGLTALFMN
jgi:PiT family inorganic phosphate transporter